MAPEIGIPEPGQIFEGKFRIDGLLGEGGMGVVLKATHALMDTPVAIKMLHPALAGQPSSVTRFLREARNAAAVRSEHVGQVLDVAKTASGLPYIVMELMPGVDLAVLCQERRQLAVAEAATYTLQACVAIAEAHALGIVHRDIKPSNLFLTTRVDGSPLVKVFDFGISKRSGDGREDTETLTKTGMALGTPCYMAPEQIADAKSVDERVDVWSLGVMLYEMLTGRLPFEGDTAAAVMAQVAVATPPPLSKLRPDAPADLAALVHRCLEKVPDKRVPNVAVLARGLSPFVPSEFAPLAARVERSRNPPPKKMVATPSDAFRRVLADAATVVGAPQPPSGLLADSGPPAERAEKVASAGPITTSPRPAGEPDYARRAFAVAVYVAVLVTLFVGLALLRPARGGDVAAAGSAGPPRESAGVSAASTGVHAGDGAGSPPVQTAVLPASSEPAGPSVIVTPAPTVEPVASAPAASGTASARPRPAPSGRLPGGKVPDDFLISP